METKHSIHDFDGFAFNMVNIKATHLVRSAGFPLDEIEDIKQDMLLDLLERLPKFDPSKSSFKLFVTCVIDRKARNLIRHRQSEMRDRRREECSLNDEVRLGINQEPVQRYTLMDNDDADIRIGRHRQTAEERHHLEMEVENVLAKLPAELRRAAELLQTMSVTQAARAMGVPRRTFREKHLVQLREALADYGQD